MEAETEDNGPRQLDGYQSRELVRLGFDPGIPVYEISSVDFGLERVKQALFGSLASTPVLLPLEFVDDVGDASVPAEFRKRAWSIPMVAETVRVFYPPEILYQGQEQALVCLEQPEWYVSGYLYKAPLNPDPDRIRINAYITSKGRDEPSEIDVVLLQLVRRPSAAAASTTLVWGQGIPGVD